MANLVESMKKAAKEVMDQSKPVALIYGTVISANPLKIKIDQKLTLTEDDLILCRNVTDYSTQMRIGGGSTTTVYVKNALTVNESVIMIRSDGGQEYLVLDRAVSE